MHSLIWRVKSFQIGGDAMDVIGKLRRMIDERGWSTYRFSKECGLPEATIGNVFRRNTVPTIGTLEIMCQGLGITLAQFFSEGDTIEVTPELKDIIDIWTSMTPQQHEAAKEILVSIKKL